MIFTPLWLAAGAVVFFPVIMLCIWGLTRPTQVKEVAPQEDRDQDEYARLRKLERVWRHCNYQERFGVSFNDFVRKVDAGTWGELAD